MLPQCRNLSEVCRVSSISSSGSSRRARGSKGVSSNGRSLCRSSVVMFHFSTRYSRQMKVNEHLLYEREK